MTQFYNIRCTSVHVVLFLACLGGRLAAPTSNEEAFAAWAAANARLYATAAERALRLAAFAANMARMVELQALSPHARYAPDEFFDWTAEERKGLAGLNERKQRGTGATAVGHATGSGFPPNGIVTFTDQSVRKAFAAGDLDWYVPMYPCTYVPMCATACVLVCARVAVCVAIVETRAWCTHAGIAMARWMVGHTR